MKIKYTEKGQEKVRREPSCKKLSLDVKPRILTFGDKLSQRVVASEIEPPRDVFDNNLSRSGRRFQELSFGFLNLSPHRRCRHAGFVGTLTKMSPERDNFS